MIDPLISLAHSTYSSKGVYALLIGSGVSRSAGIPTGWEIVLDLIGRLAVLEGVESPLNVVEWYTTTHGEEPNYSKLLESLCKSQTERQGLLAPYFEPTMEERENKLKIPTAAHHAIASLVSKGYINVIVTTNFDRLIETALQEAGITPVVLSTTDSVKGAKPLVHQGCVVIKVHGDYLDSRTKNSSKELAEYSPGFDALLDRIVDEYGLIVCGWSGDWDDALRAVLERAPNRRFPMYWASINALSQKATDLTNRRDAVLVTIKDADDFFGTLANKVLGLEAFEQPHPLSIATASATAKRFLSQPKYRINLHDLIQTETESAFVRLQNEAPRTSTASDAKNALNQYASITEMLRAMCMPVAYFSDDFNDLLCSTVVRLASNAVDQTSLELRKASSLLQYYTIGIASCASNRMSLPITIAKTKLNRLHQESEPYLMGLGFYDLHNLFEWAAENKRREFPLSEWMHEECLTTMSKLIPDESQFNLHFNQLEALMSLVFLKIDPRYEQPWAPLGRFAYGRFAKSRTELTKNQPFVDALISTGMYSSGQEIVDAMSTISKLIANRHIY